MRTYSIRSIMDNNFISPFCESENIKLRIGLDFKGYDILVPDMK